MTKFKEADDQVKNFADLDINQPFIWKYGKGVVFIKTSNDHYYDLDRNIRFSIGPWEKCIPVEIKKVEYKKEG